MSRTRAAAVLAAALVLVAGTVQAQSIEERIQQFAGETAEGYITPVADLFGANLNGNLFTTGSTRGLLGFDFGLRVMAANVPDGAKSFTATAPPLYGPAELETATAVGTEDGGGTFTATGLADYSLPGGIDLSAVPLVVPQLTVGLPFRIEGTLRYIPPLELGEDVGELSLLGIGIKHNVNGYLPPIPIVGPDIAVFYAFQALDIGDFMSTSGSQYGIIASKSIPLLSAYALFQFESSKTDIEYTTDPIVPGVAGATVDFELESEVSGRFTVGGRLNLGLIKVNAELASTFGSDNVGTIFGIGAGIGIR